MRAGAPAGEPMLYAAVAAFVLLGLLCVGLVVVGLPGTWILLGLAALIELLDGYWAPGTVTFGWLPIALGLALAVVGELLEFATGALGSKAGGGRKRGMVGAMIGGLVGGLGGTMIAPIIGTLVGALLGTFVGALVGEITGPEAMQTKEAVGPALAATAGRVVGIVAKLGVALAVWMGLSGAMLYRLFG